jgi:hypothetical protein
MEKEGSYLRLTKVSIWNLTGGGGESKRRKPQQNLLRILSVYADNRTEYLPNTNMKLYV